MGLDEVGLRSIQQGGTIEWEWGWGNQIWSRFTGLAMCSAVMRGRVGMAWRCGGREGFMGWTMGVGGVRRMRET